MPDIFQISGAMPVSNKAKSTTQFYRIGGVSHSLYGPDGQPVFPVNDGEELANLLELADLHGGAFSPAPDGKPSVGIPPLKREGMVVGVGEITHSAAELYGYLTGRKVICVSSPVELQAEWSVAVVLVDARFMTDSLMDQVNGFRSASQICPGLIVGAGQRELEISAKRAALTLALSGQKRGARTFVLPTMDVAALNLPGSDTAGADSKPETMLEKLANGASLLAMVAHTSGLMIRLTGIVNFCGLYDRKADFPNPPLCQMINRCAKFGDLPLIPAAKQKGRLKRLSAIRAEIFILYGCYVLRIDDEVIDPRYNLGIELGLHANIGCCITTWRMSREQLAPDMLPLVNDLSDGVSVGEAVARYNNRKSVREQGDSLCVLGDPEYSIAALGLPKLQSRTVSTLPRITLPALPAARSENDDLPFKRQIIEYAESKFRMASHADPAGLYLNIENLERSTSGEERERLRSEVNLGFISCLSALKRPVEAFQPFMIETSAARRAKCVGCGREATARLVRFKSLPGAKYVSTACLFCGESALAPKDAPVVPNYAGLRNGVLLVEGARPDGLQGRFAIFNEAYNKGPVELGLFSQVHLEWPKDEAGAPVQNWKLPSPLPPGDLLCTGFLVWDREFAWWGGRFRDRRGLPDNSAPLEAGDIVHN